MNPYDLITLLTVLQTTKSIQPFWGNWFKQEITFETEKIAFDQVNIEYRRMAPFVAPNVQGRVQRKYGYSTVSYAPAYVKPKDAVRPNQAFARAPGESLVTGNLTAEQRMNAAVTTLLEMQRIKIDNRIEWMRAKAIIDGKVVCEGRDYPKVTIDFNRDSSLTVTLAGAAKWDQSTATPLTDLANGKKSVNALTGQVVRDYVFGANAWALFYAKLDFTKIQNNMIRGSEGTITQFLEGVEGVEYAGTITGVNGAGLMNCYVYTQKFVDDDGTVSDILDTNTVVGIASGVEGVDCYGAIEDLGAMRALKYFPKVYDEEDPSVRYLLTQSAPLPVPKQPNCTFSIKVA